MPVSQLQLFDLLCLFYTLALVSTADLHPLLRPPAGKQRGGSSPAVSFHPRAWGDCGGAPGRADRRPGGLPRQEERGSVGSGLGEAGFAGAGRPHDIHTGAAQGDRRALLRAGGQSHARQASHRQSLRKNVLFGVSKKCSSSNVGISYTVPLCFVTASHQLWYNTSRPAGLAVKKSVFFPQLQRRA